jgi:hypothetical protein
MYWAWTLARAQALFHDGDEAHVQAGVRTLRVKLTGLLLPQ